MLLERVRDDKLYAPLGHPNIETYARERLKLGRSSLYNYLRVYDWVDKNHHEWLDPAPGMFIPDLFDAVDLIFIEGELERTDLSPEARASLEKLKDKALAGELTKTDLTPYRRRKSARTDDRKAFISMLRQARLRASKMANMPPEVLADLDDAIGVLTHAMALRLAGLEDDETPSKTAVA